MKIIRDEQLATLTLVPVEAEEEQVLASIIALLKPEDKLVYGGSCDEGENGEFCTVNLHAGSRVERKKETSGNVTIIGRDYVGGVKLVLCGTTNEDKDEVNGIRDFCYFGSGGLIFLGETEVDGKRAIITTGARCKLCDAGMITLGTCEHNVCNACAEVCEHHYIRGAIHGGDLDIGVGEFCDKCGHCKPEAEGERKMSIAEHHQAVTNELGIVVVNDSISQAELERVMRCTLPRS